MDGEEWREGEERERKLEEEEVRVTGRDGRMVEEGKQRREGQ